MNTLPRLAVTTTLLLSAGCTSPRAPAAATLTSAPLRHRLRVELRAPVGEVWALVGDHTRLPEYSAGLERVELSPGREARVCRFRPRDSADEMSLREVLRWEAAGVGYATSAEPGNAFGLEHDLSLVTVAPSTAGTIVTWQQHYDSADLPAMRAEFDGALADMGARLAARFGGRILERYVDSP
jgi:hypothetical protein